ncbi:hypothetical protein [Arthrobacter sp. KK5.5]|uniref:hypothetical protein n=1 Tax=Arthrobacter sp. KK5.5 TaxID=3373084 RepID=UPI003EE5F357
MDTQNFLMELLLVVIGGLITVVIAYFTYRFERRRQEVAGLQLLLDTVAHKRALRNLKNPRTLSVAEDNPDFVACSRSILNLRDVIQQTRATTRSETRIHSQLDHMVRACNKYLSDSRRDRSRYEQYLMELRSTVADGTRNISATYKSLRYNEPGELGR